MRGKKTNAAIVNRPDLRYQLAFDSWMGGRVVDCARLESVYTERYRGFESPPIRQVLVSITDAGVAISLTKIAEEANTGES